MPLHPETLPLVAFNLDYLLRPDIPRTDESTQALSEARLAIDAICERGRPALLSAMPRQTAATAVDEAALQFSEIHTGLRMTAQYRDALGKLAAWGYVSTYSRDLRTAATAGLHTIGVIAGKSPRSMLWEAGADIILDGFAQLPGIFRFNLTHWNGDYIPEYTAQSTLKVRGRIATGDWIKNGIVPHETDAFGYCRIPRAFVDWATETAQGRPLNRQSVELYHLVWATERGSCRARDQAIARLQILRDAGEVYGAEDIARLSQRSVNTATRWMRLGRIPAVKIDDLWFCRKEAMQWLDDATTADIDSYMGTKRGRSQRWVDRGHVPRGIKHGPTTLRHGDEMVRYAKRRHAAERRQKSYWSADQVSVELDITSETVRQWGKAQRLTSIQLNEQTFFIPEEVRGLKHKWQERNPGFEWLPPLVPGNSFLPDQAARLMGVHRRTLARLARENVVPYINRSTPGLDTLRPTYPRDYFYALRLFAGTTPVSKETAEQFAALCQEAYRETGEPAVLSAIALKARQPRRPTG